MLHSFEYARNKFCYFNGDCQWKTDIRKVLELPFMTNLKANFDITYTQKSLFKTGRCLFHSDREIPPKSWPLKLPSLWYNKTRQIKLSNLTFTVHVWCSIVLILHFMTILSIWCNTTYARPNLIVTFLLALALATLCFQSVRNEQNDPESHKNILSTLWWAKDKLLMNTT